MDKIIKKVLNTLESNGFEAYLVGGFVRDYLLGIKSLDIDICTNALPKDLHALFPHNSNSNSYGGFNLKLKKFNIDITTYRQELKYTGRKPTEIIYITSLEEDIKRRDFTINAICMNKQEKIIDLVNGIDDLNNCQIKMIGDIDEKIKEDPLRILRAIRFATVLEFTLDEYLYKKIKMYAHLIKTLSQERIKSELEKILLSKNYQKGLDLLKKTNILSLLAIDYHDLTYVNDICGMWAQLDLPQYFAFTKQERRNIINIRQIIKGGLITNYTLYNYGLYDNLVAGDILNINRKSINKMYQNMQIKKDSDLKISSEEIMQILAIKPSKELKEVKNELINLILEDKLKNSNKCIKEYLEKKKG